MNKTHVGVGLLTSALMATVSLATATVASSGEASADTTSIAECSFSAHFRVDPGVTPTLAASTFTTVGDVSLHCDGDVNGARVTGPGSYREWGATFGNCLGGDGGGWYEAQIPTTAGTQVVKGNYRLWYAVDETGGHGGETGSSIDATFQFFPAVGTCQADDPMTEFDLNQQQQLYTNSRN